MMVLVPHIIIYDERERHRLVSANYALRLQPLRRNLFDNRGQHLVLRLPPPQQRLPALLRISLQFHPRVLRIARPVVRAIQRPAHKTLAIVGVSVDTPDSHKQFCTKEGLTFRLLADPEHKVVDEYGSLGHFGEMTIAQRNTFLIDPNGKIVKVWTKVDPRVHSDEVLAALNELKK